MYPRKDGSNWFEYKGWRDKKEKEETEKERLKKPEASKDQSPKIPKPKESSNEDMESTAN